MSEAPPDGGADTSAGRRRQIVVHHENPAQLLRWQLGDVTVTRVPESVVEMSPRYLLPDLSRELLASCGGWTSGFFTDEGQILLSMHAFVIESGDLTVVVDTCIGAHTERPLPGDTGFGERLAAAVPGGPEAVDVVVCTHLHFDHVGWNTQLVGDEWVPTFPNARYLVSHDELAGTLADDHMEVIEPSIQPLLDHGQLDAVEPDHRIDAHISLVPSAGLSPGHVCVRIDAGGEQALVTGDAFHTPVQFAHPEVGATYADFEPEAAITTRRRLIDELVGTPTMVLGTHFAPPTAGWVRAGDDRAWFDVRSGS